MRILFFAGKGGVGKTSVSAATGIRAAEMGKRTVVMSLDIAHSLADIFDLKGSLLDRHRGRPVEVGGNLWIQELDVHEEIEKNWGEIHRYFSTLLNSTGLDEVLAEELAILPGMEEVSLLLYINRYVRKNEFDVIVLDCAPTGESLRFISIPTTLEWYIKKIFKIERTVARVVRPVARRMVDVPLPGDDYFAAIESLFGRLRGIDEVLADPETTSVRLVTNPEKIVLKETQRAYMYFCLYRMAVDGIIVNRLLPGGVNDPYFARWRETQQGYLETARDYFRPVPIFPVDLCEGEVLGYESLKRLAGKIYGDRNPLDRFIEDEPYRVEKENGDYRIRMKLPFLARDEVSLNRVGDEVVVRVGSFKRHLLVPRQAASSSGVRARLEGQDLSIIFEGGNHG